MFTTQQLSTLQIRHLIIHDVPNPRLSPGALPRMSETESELDPRRIRHLRDRLVAAISSSSAYDIVFLDETSSPVPGTVRAVTTRFDLDEFVAMSQAVARHLHENQFANISSGLLAIMDATVAGRSAVVVMKIERQEGLQLELAQRNGRATFAIEVLDNLVLTEGTRLFKAALFRRTGREDGDFEGAASDSQNAVRTADDVAKFWLRFLGCALSERPRVRTTRFFDTALGFINDVITDPVQRNSVYEALVSELRSQRRTLAPRTFMEDHLPGALRPALKSYFEERNVPMTQFTKDVEDIQRQLHRRTLTTTRGVSITAPMDEEGLIGVGAEQIVVYDSLERVGKKK